MRRYLEQIERFSIFDWAPNPFAAILWRELLTTLRQRRYGFILIGAASILLFIILQNMGRMAFWTISPAMVITNVLTVQYTALLAFLFLVIPALAAVTLASERQQKTEDLLYTALFRPVTLIAGKLLAVLAVFGVFHVALLPLAAFIYFFAGIEIRAFFQVQFLLYTTALFHTIIGVMASRCIESPNRAVLLAYVFVFGIYGAPFGVAYYGAMPAAGAGAVALQATPNPVILVSGLLASTHGWGDCARLFGYQAAGTVIIGLLCILGVTLQRATTRGWSRLSLGGGQTRPSRHPIPNWGNAVYHKDRRTHTAAQPPWIIVLFVLSAVGGYIFNDWSSRHMDFSITGLDAGAIAIYILAPFLVIESCNYEMAPNTLVLLRLTRLGSDRVLVGKALAVYQILLPALLGIIAGTVAIIAMRGLPALNAGAGPGQNLLGLTYQSVMLFPKVALAVALCFAFCRFRSPGPADLATNIALTGVFLAIAEAISYGLFQSMLDPELGRGAIAIIGIGHMISLGFSVVITFALAQMRFEAVFDEGSDVYAITHVDRRNF